MLMARRARCLPKKNQRPSRLRLQALKSPALPPKPAKPVAPRSSRNLPKLRTTLAHQVNPYDLMNCEMLLLTRDGLDRMKEVFAR